MDYEVSVFKVKYSKFFQSLGDKFFKSSNFSIYNSFVNFIILKIRLLVTSGSIIIFRIKKEP